ncbi:MAG: hypothetical protein EB127_03350 [Alphaproteobacteria bacterium]|nr:hypothetical protein [Alphaproteobacteria bacterium]
MDLNRICLGLLGLVPLYLIYLYWMTPVINPYPSIPGLLVAMDTGKSKHYVSKHGDASMVTESLRRRTILSVGRENPKKIHETTSQLGSGTGYLETFLLSSICIGFCPCPYPNNVLYDGGNATDEYCPLDDNTNDGQILDAGNATTQGCA